jgi:hypothetical protein
MIVLWDIAPYSLVEVDRRFRGAYCLHYHGVLKILSVVLKLLSAADRRGETIESIVAICRRKRAIKLV